MLRKLTSTLARCQRGAMAIETALVVPILCLLALGTFDVSSMVSRQQELQSAANEASTIVLAAANSTGVSSTDLEKIIESSVSLKPDQLVISQEYRCDAATARTSNLADCDTSKPIYAYVKLVITDSYTPLWTSFGVGSTFNYSVTRTVQVS
ncbi:TadE/TadG family type IV pilus assembly protein [Paraurantiacibacter namhicola]|uniref:TadE-like protein n=1 Tax=Paraurantiacibacter namhicola TaxID=645517 RepID=A0A1C7D9Q4_9SPHN|nr:TadE/TadG family type IV pilus assembly protein [Paraurantiacibacter namhicola]ANU08041.1 TadE-like protein [Paraurantiacibacter namhicola]